MLALVMTLLKTFGGPVISYFTNKQKASQQAAQAKFDIRAATIQADLQNIKEGKEAEYAWDDRSLQVSPWRSEYLTVILSMPLIAVFIKPLVPYIVAGFAALEATPLWYRAMVMTMVASAFGYQKLMDYIDKTSDSPVVSAVEKVVASGVNSVVP